MKKETMNPTTEPKLVMTPTKCKLCGHVFKSDLLREAAMLGGNPQAKLQQVQAMTKPLMIHLEKKHPEIIYNAQLTGGEFAGYLTMLAFECDEDVLVKMGSDYTRWQVHKLTARQGSIPSDERIRERIEQFAKDELEIYMDRSSDVPKGLIQKMTTLLCEMRDSITEKDRYQPQRPAVDVN